ncbi:MAG: molybdopterin-binding protein [Anaerolineales bacterium]|nr:molybdopterin-binding protein [Anaerolineales bacterium]
MKFGPIPTAAAEGKLLGHNIAAADGRRALRKGRVLSAADVALLHQLGRDVVYVAELEPGDVLEDAAAGRVAAAVAGPHLRHTGPTTGRVNLYATALGLLRVDAARLLALNEQPGITLATLRHNTAVSPAKMVATVKIIPYAVPETAVRAVEALQAAGPLVHVDPLPNRRVDLLLSGSPAARERIVGSFDPPLRQRIEQLGSTLASVDFIPLEDEHGERALAEAICQRVAAGSGLLLLAGETAIMDAEDIAPRAVRRAGGSLTVVGAPVDPGNLLMLAAVGDVPLLGAPGCARSPKANIVDALLPRLLAGDRLTRADVLALGHGGLLEDVPERPFPRSRIQ